MVWTNAQDDLVQGSWHEKSAVDRRLDKANKRIYVTGLTGDQNDITDATEVLIVAQKPDETEVEWTGEVSGTTVVRYTTVADDLDQEGVWLLQAKVTTLDGVWLGNTVSLPVYPAFG